MASDTPDQLTGRCPHPYTGQYPLSCTCTVQNGPNITRLAAACGTRTHDLWNARAPHEAALVTALEIPKVSMLSLRIGMLTKRCPKYLSCRSGLACRPRDTQSIYVVAQDWNVDQEIPKAVMAQDFKLYNIETQRKYNFSFTFLGRNLKT